MLSKILLAFVLAVSSVAALPIANEAGTALDYIYNPGKRNEAGTALDYCYDPKNPECE